MLTDFFSRITKSWAARSSYILVLLVLLAFALMVILSSLFMGNIVRKQLAYNAQAALDSLETSIKTDLREPRTILGNLSETVRGMILHGAGADEVHTYLRETASYVVNTENKLLSGFIGIYGFFDVFGGVALDGLDRTAPEDLVFTERSWYRDAVAAKGEIVFLHPYVDIISHEVIITFARGLFDEKGTLLGVIALDVELERIREYIINANLGKLGFGVLFNEQLEFISHVDPSYHGTKIADVSSDTAKMAADIELGNDISEYGIVNHLGVYSIIFVRRLENGWYTAIITPENEYFLEVRRIRAALIILGFILAAVLSVFLLRLAAEKQESDTRANEVEEKTKTFQSIEKVLNSLDSMIYVTAPKTGEILFVNDQMKKRYKIEYDCVGQLCYEIFQQGLYDKCENCPCRQLDKDPGKIVEWVECSLITKRSYRYTAYYIEWLDGEMVLLQQSVDITELNDAKEQAIEANRVKNNFLAKMSHEMRTPMNVILGITEMQLENENLPSDTREALDKVHHSSYSLLGIINDILDLSRIEAGKLKLTPVTYDITGLIIDTVQLNLMRFESKPIAFELLVDENIPSTLFGDELRIKQILNNILSNAYKYTESGKVSLSAAAEVRSASEPVTLVFRVSDTGRGMTQEQVDNLFHDYSRFNSEANRTTEGTGLGMSIARQLVSLMNGEISVESIPGAGSVFTVRLAQGYVDSGVLGKENAENMSKMDLRKIPKKKAAQIIREYMPYGTVLVVDDMEPNLYVARGLLGPYGLSIETASSGFEAVDRVKNGAKYDIIFMDHFMPEMDGIETVKTIRGLGYTSPIVALTANALAGQAGMFLANGFDGFISKPIDIRQLNTTLNKLIRDNHPAEVVEAARQLKEKLVQNTNSARHDLSQVKALIVDDFLPNLNVAAGLLRKYKIQADCASSGQEAVDRIKSGAPVYNFIFMDHLMPGMDGIEAARAIRALDTEYAKNMPIFALTGNDAAGNRQMFLDNGFLEVLPKPLSVAKMDAFIKKWTEDKNNEDGLDEGRKNLAIEIPGVNEKKVMELYDGDMNIFLSVLRSYLFVIPAALGKIRTVTAQTLPDYTVSVHGIKSTSESIGAGEAREMAAELEALAKAGDLSGVQAKNEALIIYVTDLLANIQTWLTRLDAK